VCELTANETVDVNMETANDVTAESHMETSDVAARPKLPPISGEMLSVRTYLSCYVLSRYDTLKLTIISLDQTGTPNLYTQSQWIVAEIYNDNVLNVTNKPFSNFYLKIHDHNHQWRLSYVIPPHIYFAKTV